MTEPRRAFKKRAFKKKARKKKVEKRAATVTAEAKEERSPGRSKPIRQKQIKTVKGFEVNGQRRSRLRNNDPLTGEIEGTPWVVFGERDGMFQWRIGPLNGYAGPTLGHALRAMKKAHRALTKIQEVYGELPKEQVDAIYRLLRWERRLHQGRLKIEGPASDGSFRVRELD